jgi:hypothetical protein
VSYAMKIVAVLILITSVVGCVGYEAPINHTQDQCLNGMKRNMVEQRCWN